MATSSILYWARTTKGSSKRHAWVDDSEAGVKPVCDDRGGLTPSSVRWKEPGDEGCKDCLKAE